MAVRPQLHPGKGILAILVISCEVSPVPAPQAPPGLELQLLSPAGQCGMKGQPGVAVCPRAQLAQRRGGSAGEFQEEEEGGNTELWQPLCPALPPLSLLGPEPSPG